MNTHSKALFLNVEPMCSSLRAKQTSTRADAKEMATSLNHQGDGRGGIAIDNKNQNTKNNTVVNPNKTASNSDGGNIPNSRQSTPTVKNEQRVAPPQQSKATQSPPQQDERDTKKHPVSSRCSMEGGALNHVRGEGIHFLSHYWRSPSSWLQQSPMVPSCFPLLFTSPSRVRTILLANGLSRSSYGATAMWRASWQMLWDRQCAVPSQCLPS